MGAKNSKFEGNYLPETPKLHRFEMLREDLQQHATTAGMHQLVDPRSPIEGRTPILVSNMTRYELLQESAKAHAATNKTENPLTLLRRRLLGGFVLHKNESETPEPQNIIDAIDRTLNLDDTFADLFVESRAREPQTTTKTESTNAIAADAQLQKAIENVEEMQMEVDAMPDVIANDNEPMTNAVNYEIEETMDCQVLLKQTPKEFLIKPAQPQQQEFDPRSPTIGLNRTPLVFDDDEEIVNESGSLTGSTKKENAMLESVLELLSLDSSVASSSSSFVTSSSNQDTPASNNCSAAPLVKVTKTGGGTPFNKHLDLNRRRNLRNSPVRKQRQPIFEDNENKPNILNKSVGSDSSDSGKYPLIKKNKMGKTAATRRMPFQCVKNRTSKRSLSEGRLSNKSKKESLELISFDDFLNPMQSSKFSDTSSNLETDGDLLALKLI